MRTIITIITVLAYAMVASTARADIVIFDDALSTDPKWTKAGATNIVTDPNDSGNQVLSGTVVTLYDKSREVPGTQEIVGADHFLQFDITTADTTQVGMELFLEMSNRDTEDLYFDERGPGDMIYNVDGVDVVFPSDGSGVPLDTDPATWQTVRIDLVQTCIGGASGRSFDPYVDTIGNWKLNSVTGGGTTMYIDNVKLVTVPEPTTLGLLVLGGLAVFRRKRS